MLKQAIMSVVNVANLSTGEKKKSLSQSIVAITTTSNMSFISGELVVQCVLCNSTTTIDSEEVDFDVSTSEENMGPESIYNWGSEVQCPHPGCGNVMTVEYSISEYPEGVLNNELVNVKAGRVISGFDIDFQSEDMDEE